MSIYFYQPWLRIWNVEIVFPYDRKHIFESLIPQSTKNHLNIIYLTLKCQNKFLLFAFRIMGSKILESYFLFFALFQNLLYFTLRLKLMIEGVPPLLDGDKLCFGMELMNFLWLQISQWRTLCYSCLRAEAFSGVRPIQGCKGNMNMFVA